MKRNFRSLLVASAVAVSAAGLGAAGTEWSQGQSQQSQQSSSQGQSQQSTQSQEQAAQPPAQGRDEAAARQRLVQAKEALTDLTQLPEASQLQGDARTSVIQIINAFNSLVTAESDWYERYQDVQQQLARALGSQAGSAEATTGAEGGAVGTSGTTPVDIPAPVRNKLAEFRQHLNAFGEAAGAPRDAADSRSSSGSASAAGTSSSVGSMSGTAGSTASQGTTGSGSASGAGSTAAQQGSTATSGAQAGETFQQHFDAIGDLLQQALSGGTAGTAGTAGSTAASGATGTSGIQESAASSTSVPVTVDRATLEQIQSHVQRLRQLARERGIQ